MANFWKVVNEVISNSDILLFVLDSKLSFETLNKEIEDKIKKLKKPHLYVLNKCDLVNKEKMQSLKKKLNPSIFVSSTKYHGFAMLREKIIVLGKQNYKDKDKYVVGVIGYPNVGKSSLINAMNGRKSAGVSSISGYTRGVQKIKADNKITFLDTPGVIPYKEKNETKHAIISSVDPSKVKDPDIAVYKLMKEYKGLIEDHFQVKINEDLDTTLEEIALKKNILKKGKEADIDRLSRLILKKINEGEIKLN